MCGGEDRRRRRRRHFFFAFYERRVFAAEGGRTSVDREKRVVRVDWRGSVVVRTPFLLAKKNFAKSIPLVSEAGVLLSSQTNKSEEGVETCSSLKKALNMKPYTSILRGLFVVLGMVYERLKNRSQ